MRCSVLLPVYNARQYIRQAIDSILAQSYHDFELILIDDGSNDGSGEILNEFVEKDHRVQLVTQSNSGLIFTLNRAVSLADSELLVRMDADDIAEPDRIMKQLAYLDAHPGCVAVGTSVQLIDPEDRNLRVMSPPMEHEDIDAMGLGGLGAAIFHPTAIIRRSALEKIGGYHEEYPHAEDVDLFLRLAEVGRLANLPDVGLRYRVHLASIGYTRRAEQAASARRAACDACMRRGLPSPEWNNLPEKDRDLFQTQMMWAWWALGDGNLSSARLYARKALCRRPFSPKTWKLLACALRGH